MKSKVMFWSILSIVFAVMALAIAVLSIHLKNERETTVEISNGAYVVGALNEQGERVGAETSIVSAELVKTDGLTVDVKKHAKLTYRIYFYNSENVFMTATADLSSDFNGENIPEGASSALVVITAIEDADGKLTLEEGLQLAEKVHVQVNK